MCGICGIVDFDAVPPRERLANMVATLEHRGPDAHGIHTNDDFALGHTRLAIIDLSPTGAQPMTSADGHAVMSYNGELYNYRELRRELEAGGATFRGASDSEVVLEAYLQWGNDAFRRFNGIFAIAIWDYRTDELLLVRDRFGIKPLYLHRNGRRTLFASEIKAILASGCVQPELDYRALHEFLYFRSPLGDRTMFQGIESVKPASIVCIGRTGETQTTYWEPSVNLIDVDEAEAVEEIRRRLESGIASQLVADVPVGVFLSGGIDSSAIAAFAARHSKERLKTYSVGFDFSNGTSELPTAKALASELGTEHHELHVKGDDLAPVLEELVHVHDHPFSDPANIPLYLLCRELGGTPKVILQGDGGDEIFAGYYRYSLMNSPLVSNPVAPSLASPLAKLVPRSGRFRRGGRVLEVLGERHPGRRLAMFMTSESPSNPPVRVLSKHARRLAEHFDPFTEYVIQDERFSELDPVQRMLFTDTQILLPNIYLEKVDRPTMATSMEVRVPLLDNEIVDYAMSLPTELKIRKGEKKYLLRQALRGTVPDSILDAPKKGFSVPESQWLQTSLSGFMKEVLLDRSVADDGLLDRAVLEQMVTQHVAGETSNGGLLWNTLNLALWLEKYNPQL